jgi:hypothetical protein
VLAFDCVDAASVEALEAGLRKLGLGLGFELPGWGPRLLVYEFTGATPKTG